MNRKPILNAAAAFVYILVLVALFNLLAAVKPKENPFIMPVTFISLFTLSAAVMAYLFGLEPVQLFLEGKKKQAIAFFLQTLMTFAALTVIMLILLLSGVFSK